MSSRPSIMARSVCLILLVQLSSYGAFSFRSASLPSIPPASELVGARSRVNAKAPLSSKRCGRKSFSSAIIYMSTTTNEDKQQKQEKNNAKDEIISPEAATNGANGDHGENESHDTKSLPPLLQKVADKVGKIDESRYTTTPNEYLNGNLPKLFSNIQYHKIEDENGIETLRVVSAEHSNTNFISSSALLCGTALGCGLLTLPTAVSGAGFLPTGVASLVAWAYMTISALLTSELLINRYGETGNVRNVGLLELYNSYLGGSGDNSKSLLPWGKVAGVGFLIVSYIVMGVYLSEGGDQLMRLFDMATTTSTTLATTASSTTITEVASSSAGNDIPLMASEENLALSRTIFAAVMGTFLSGAARYNTVQRTMTNVFVPMTLAIFVATIVIGLPTCDFGALLSLENQHPELVLSAFPLLFMSYTFHGVVPRVVYDLEGDKDKITKAIVLGSTTALIMYLAWNAVILGNVLGGDGGGSVIDAAGVSLVVSSLEESSAVVLGSDLVLGMDGDAAAAITTTAASSLNSFRFDQRPLLQTSVGLVSELAVITSLIGVVLGFVNEFNDAIFSPTNDPSYGPKEKEDNKWKVALLTLLPPAIVSIGLGYYTMTTGTDDGSTVVNNYEIIDYTGIFGSSILFLIFPALMAWQNRYGEEDPPRPLTVRPMVPLGKIPLGSLYKAAGTLIVEQGLEKLGVFEYVRELLGL